MGSLSAYQVGQKERIRRRGGGKGWGWGEGGCRRVQEKKGAGGGERMGD